MLLSWDQDKYILAYKFAANAHRNQTVKGRPDLPYIIHPSLVSMEVIAALQVEQGLDGNLCVQCALLHDVIEDCHVPFDDIKTVFGEKVAAGVLALSKTRNSKELLSIKDYLRGIQEQPREVWMVKLADRITNLQPPPRGWSKKRINEYRQEAVEILNTVGSASSFLAARLRYKIEKYGQKSDT